MTEHEHDEVSAHREQVGGMPLPEGTAERLTLLPESMREYAIFSLDVNGYVESWNSGAERVKGYRAEEITGRHFSVFYPPEQAESGYPSWELTQATEVGFFIDEGWRVRADGSRFWAHVVITAQRERDGTLRGFIKVTRDMTEAQDRLQRSSRRFTDLLDLTPVGIGLFDASERLLDANGALCDLLGYRRRDVYGLTGADLLHPDDRAGGLTPEGRGPNASVVGQRFPQRVLARADGRPVPCDVHSALSVQDDGSRFWLTSFQDVSERIRHTETLHHQATHDDLTGLLNRQGINELIGEMLDDAPDSMAVLFCDFDNFKRVNDSLGHEAGDELLMALARRLRSGLPEQCRAARLSGDEFLVLCSDVDAIGGLEELATWISEFLRTLVPVRGQLVQVSAAVGAARFDSSIMDGEDLLRFADAAMFRAKRQGAGQVALASPDLATSLGGQLRLEEELREAITNDGLSLYYQPMLARDGSVMAAEALVRWFHPERGLLTPDVILSVAEQGGLLRELDLRVLRTALRQAMSWPTSHGRPVDVAVNLASLLPDDPDFVDEVTEIVTKSGIDWHRVVLEVVETSLLDLPSRPRKGMVELTERGMRFAMDDFGTGYSSLARLKDLPIQIIKIDRRFISGVEDDSADLAITRAAVDIGRAMGRTCVAEGVETASQFRILGELGMDTYQGFLFSRPVPAAEFRDLLDSSPLPVPDER
ncbi:putative bifunctional diguanylate cyclase/phosphodiesterase [Haloactinomyces albus]|uniref:Diguanylate cyclase (GGDEF)-like protein/PAS domain S-box-containing protein n=1 Tax=Haloactinomyces albus TaxID=1352928 RepID=A0AAE3ZG35_9ACTN|nr:EAL domain-containing protein [Haloactinomyces albus]MDR7302948.1 diguanylate cyclase (GGDEF)-like protein/PAS domain S-box-containing protein [Haloactinomyces albus]